MISFHGLFDSVLLEGSLSLYLHEHMAGSESSPAALGPSKATQDSTAPRTIALHLSYIVYCLGLFHISNEPQLKILLRSVSVSQESAYLLSFLRCTVSWPSNLVNIKSLRATRLISACALTRNR